MIGRPCLYGLAAGCERGVTRALDIFRSEMERVMKHAGCDLIRKPGPGYVKRIRG
ncbi:MAG TPA: alpha-hydroxy-acid oxidizing protein [Spirochaetota bacterium]|nr:alpha-hydroxy-acid oxidizing protein [Spirochaetota bacterium]HOD15264.1 alpha-hydroxy-acid oxidizing protein [Spirochaetota bacterium]HPG52198.1 alpha-hydroxy-acid oxidizing protein [Spirochaetota bacterium]HPN13428.1 alpha-hydroxy-acid oxidizing protein [Spirochaetota bacterium]